MRLPMVELPAGQTRIEALLRRQGAFAGLLVHGMLLQSLRLGEYAGLRLLGPGDIVSLTQTPASMLVLDAECRATVPTSVGLFGRELLLASRRWPWLIAGLHGRMAEQSERLTTQLMICQLPRVDDRLLAMLWLLAESWGQVTGAGTLLPIELTHSALGGLIGARRPTVTLALSELTERGAVVRQADGWLLLDAPKAPAAGRSETIGVPRPLTPTAPLWTDEPRQATPEEQHLEDQAVYAQLRETVSRLRSDHQVREAKMRERLAALAASRERMAARRSRKGILREPRRP